MSDLVAKKPVGSFNYTEPETRVYETTIRPPVLRQEHDSGNVAVQEQVDSKVISAIVRKFLAWNR